MNVNAVSIAALVRLIENSNAEDWRPTPMNHRRDWNYCTDPRLVQG